MRLLKVLGLLWNLAHQDEVPTDIMDQALNAHIKILDYSCSQVFYTPHDTKNINTKLHLFMDAYYRSIKKSIRPDTDTTTAKFFARNFACETRVVAQG